MWSPGYAIHEDRAELRGCPFWSRQSSKPYLVQEDWKDGVSSWLPWVWLSWLFFKSKFPLSFMNCPLIWFRIFWLMKISMYYRFFKLKKWKILLPYYNHQPREECCLLPYSLLVIFPKYIIVWMFLYRYDYSIQLCVLHDYNWMLSKPGSVLWYTSGLLMYATIVLC